LENKAIKRDVKLREAKYEKKLSKECEKKKEDLKREEDALVKKKQLNAKDITKQILAERKLKAMQSAISNKEKKSEKSAI